MGGPQARSAVRARSHALAVMLAAALIGGYVASQPAHAATTRHMSPDQSLANVLAHTHRGDTVRLSPGTYSAQYVRGLHLGGVTVIGHSTADTSMAGLVLDDVSGVAFRDFTVTNAASAGDSAVKLEGGSANITLSHLRVLPRVMSGVDIGERSHDVRVLHSVIDGRYVTGNAATNGTARGIRINGSYQYGYDPAYWVHDIVVAGNRIRHAGSDDIQIVGASGVVIRGNHIERPQKNADHNDGVQSVASSNLLIAKNVFVAPGTASPDQAIILGGDASNPYLRVSDVRVVNNIVHDWRGAGVIVAGATHVRVANNTVQDTSNASVAIVRPSGLAQTGISVVNNVLAKLEVSGTSVSEGHNCVRSGGHGAGDTAADPRFRPHTLYRLQADSPCRGRANSTAPSRDFGGRQRDHHPDAGAWEYLPS